MEKLPTEILETILSGCTLKDRFKVATLTKCLYEKIRHIPLNIIYDVDSKKGESTIGSFFHTTVLKVNIMIEMPLNFHELKCVLRCFYYLQTIIIRYDLEDILAHKIAATLPMSPQNISLEIMCPEKTCDIFNSIIKRRRKFVALELPINENNSNYSTKNNKRMLSPTSSTEDSGSPLKKIINPIIEEAKKELEKLMLKDNSNSVQDVPNSLIINKLVEVNTKYKRVAAADQELLNLNLNNYNEDLEDIETIVSQISKSLAECIIRFDDCWVFVTECEVYYRNCVKIDDCANESFNIVYPSQFEAYQQKKTERNNSWTEISIFLGRFECLITGGFLGYNDENTLTPFLGTSIKGLRPMNINKKTQTDNIFIKQEAANVLATNRRLRQYKKQAAGRKWCFQSTRFKAKGFFATNPLEVHNLSQEKKTISMAPVASYILLKISQNQFRKEDTTHVFNLLRKTSFFATLKKKPSLAYFKTLVNSLKLSDNNQAVVKCFISLAGGKLDELSGEETVAVYKGALASFCKNEDSRKIKNNTHLL